MGRVRSELYRKEARRGLALVCKRPQATAISNGIASLHREHYGRGADGVRTTIKDDFVLTALEDCFTVVEKKMIDEGQFGKVRETRTMFQDWMRPRFTQIVEDATGRTVRAFFSQVSHDPDIAIELFFLFQETEPSSDGRGPALDAELAEK
jgi:uncharacterized protein YbcI